MWLGQAQVGTHLAPDAIRMAGLTDYLKLSHDDIMDIGNLDIKIEPCAAFQNKNCRINNLEAVRDGIEILASSVSEIIMNGRFPLILGGDHSIAIGTIAGIAKHYRKLGVIWYDAHADCNTPDTSPSGNIQGMPLAASIGRGHPYLVEAGGYRNKVSPEHVVLIGTRDLDPGEKEFICEKQIKMFTADNVCKMGIGNVIDEAVFYLASKCDGIHLSFDLDAIDPQDVCGVGTPVEGGIRLEQSLEAMSILSNYNVITSAEFVEVNPILDKDEKTIMAALLLMQALLKK